MKREGTLADPIQLAPVDETDTEIVVVVVRTPKAPRKQGCTTDEHIFQLSKVLSAGVSIPSDCGFVPSTRWGDGGPLDVLVLMDQHAFPGCKLRCRIIGLIEGAQGRRKNAERNERLVAIEVANHSYARVRRIEQLGKEFERELEEFFVACHRLSGKKYKITAVKGPHAGYGALERAQNAVH
jgi:inorganic pyrophosphatase